MSRLLNRFVLPLAGFLLLAAILAVALKRAPGPGGNFVKSALIGKPAPTFDLPNLTEPGRTVHSTQFKGRWYLLNVWGTWCVECRVEHPVLLDIQREGKATVVGLNYKDQDALAIDWLRQLGNPYVAVAVDKEGRTAMDWGVYGAPETFLVDPRGIVVHKRVGALTQDAWRKDFLPLIEAGR